MEFDRAIAVLARLAQGADERKRKRLGIPLRTVERVRKGDGNPTLRSIIDVGKLCGFEIEFRRKEG